MRSGAFTFCSPKDNAVFPLDGYYMGDVRRDFVANLQQRSVDTALQEKIVHNKHISDSETSQKTRNTDPMLFQFFNFSNYIEVNLSYYAWD